MPAAVAPQACPSATQADRTAPPSPQPCFLCPLRQKQEIQEQQRGKTSCSDSQEFPNVKIRHWKRIKGWGDNRSKGRMQEFHFADVAGRRPKTKHLNRKQYKMGGKEISQKAQCPEGVSALQFGIYMGQKSVLLFFLSWVITIMGLNSITGLYINMSIKSLLRRVFFPLHFRI